MKTEAAIAPAASAFPGWLYRIGGEAAVLVGLLLLAGMIGLIAGVLLPEAAGGLLSSIQNIWLVTIFKLHAGFAGVQIGLLDGAKALDVAILALTALMYVGLYAALRDTSRAWSIVAGVQPFLGLGLLLATQSAGRSAVMGAALVISLVMLRSRTFARTTAWAGILASVLLLAGDFTAGVIPPLDVMAALVAAGYLLFIAWFVLVGVRLHQLEPERPQP